MAERENHGATGPKEEASGRDVRRKSTGIVNPHRDCCYRNRCVRAYDGWVLGGSAAMAGGVTFPL